MVADYSMKSAKKEVLKGWILEVLEAAPGNRATIVDICRAVWERHADELRAAGDLFYTWQYDIRWAATELRKQGVIAPAESSPRGVWELHHRARRRRT